jgi:hypothetical protein
MNAEKVKQLSLNLDDIDMAINSNGEKFWVNHADSLWDKYDISTIFATMTEDEAIKQELNPENEPSCGIYITPVSNKNSEEKFISLRDLIANRWHLIEFITVYSPEEYI